MDEMHTAPVQSVSTLYMPLSASVPSTSTVPDVEEVKEVEVDDRSERKKRERDTERRLGVSVH